MWKTQRGWRTILFIGCLVSLTGCPIFFNFTGKDVPSPVGSAGSQGSQVRAQNGTLELTIKWPSRQVQGFNTQAIPLSTNALIVWIRKGDSVLEKKTVARDPGNSTTTTQIKLPEGNNLAIEAKAYRETAPEDGVNGAIARGTATTNIVAEKTTPLELTLDALTTPSITSLSNNFGTVGDTITLTGSGFGSGSIPVEVLFNQTKATEVTRTSETELTVKVPENAKTGKLTVKADGIDSISNAVYWVSDGIVILAPPKAILPKEITQLITLMNMEFAPGENGNDYAPAPVPNLTSSDTTTIQVDKTFIKGLKLGNAEIRSTIGTWQSPAVTIAVRQYVSSTIAGGSGNGDGQGLNCIIKPYGMDQDSQGNIYVTETDANRIRKIDPNGNVTTFAGNNSAGYSDGTGTNASFNGPRGIAVDASDNVYVADYGNYCIRKITPQGVVSTFIGDGSSGNLDGNGTSARLVGPSDIGKGNNGNFIFTDGCNVRSFTASGQVCTVNGSELAGLTYPQGLVMLPNGDIIVCDTYNNRLRTIHPNGQVATIITDDGYDVFHSDGRVEPKLQHPNDISLDASGNVLVSDPVNHCLWKLNLSTNSFTRCSEYESGYQEGPLSTAKFNSPHGLLLCTDNSVLVADTLNYRIRKITSNSTTPLYGSGSPNLMNGPALNARFNHPTELAFDPMGNLIILDRDNYLLRKISKAGIVSTIAGGRDTSMIQGGTGSGFQSPDGIAVDSSGNIFLTDSHYIKKIDPSGNVTKVTNGGNSQDNGPVDIAGFWNPHGLVFDEVGNLYIADYQNAWIRKLNTDGMVSTIAGKSYLTGDSDGQGLSATFFRPKDIAYTPTKLFVTDYHYQSIRRIDAQANVTTVHPIFENSETQFSQLAGIAVDAAENLYVLDMHRIWKVNPSGFVTLVAGGGYSGYQDGTGSNALFNQPEGIALDGEGNLYIGDSGNHIIRKLTLQ